MGGIASNKSLDDLSDWICAELLHVYRLTLIDDIHNKMSFFLGTKPNWALFEVLDYLDRINVDLHLYWQQQPVERILPIPQIGLCLPRRGFSKKTFCSRLGIKIYWLPHTSVEYLMKHQYSHYGGDWIKPPVSGLVYPYLGDSAQSWDISPSCESKFYNRGFRLCGSAKWIVGRFLWLSIWR